MITKNRTHHVLVLSFLCAIPGCAGCTDEVARQKGDLAIAQNEALANQFKTVQSRTDEHDDDLILQTEQVTSLDQNTFALGNEAALALKETEEGVNLAHTAADTANTADATAKSAKETAESAARRLGEMEGTIGVTIRSTFDKELNAQPTIVALQQAQGELATEVANIPPPAPTTALEERVKRAEEVALNAQQTANRAQARFIPRYRLEGTDYYEIDDTWNNHPRTNKGAAASFHYKGDQTVEALVHLWRKDARGIPQDTGDIVPRPVTFDAKGRGTYLGPNQRGEDVLFTVPEGFPAFDLDCWQNTAVAR